jgi:hypothetical protein
MGACVELFTGDDPTPKIIIDTATLMVALDNQGNATLQISVLTQSDNIASLGAACIKIDTQCVVFPLGDKSFKGFLDSDNMKLVEGSKYYEHNIVARGIIC